MVARALLPAALLVLDAATALAQRKAMSIQEYRTMYDGTSLDSTYRSALHIDSTQAVFGDRKQEFWEAWMKFMKALNGHLKANGFNWTKDTRCTTRIYFSADGRVDHFLYSFRGEDLGEEQRKRFDQLLNDFLLENGIGISSDEQFAQCGPIMFKAERNIPPPEAPSEHP